MTIFNILLSGCKDYKQAVEYWCVPGVCAHVSTEMGLKSRQGTSPYVSPADDCVLQQCVNPNLLNPIPYFVGLNTKYRHSMTSTYIEHMNISLNGMCCCCACCLLIKRTLQLQKSPLIK